MNILIIGSGGREHALIHAAKRSPMVKQVFAAPGNGGILQDATLAPIEVNDHQAVVAWCKEQAIDLVIVGPEAPLVDGIADALRDAKIPVFGPSKAASELEGSKAFMKRIAKDYNVPTAAYEVFTEKAEALAYVKKQGAPIVVKTDGLAAGKGVTVAMDEETALHAVEEFFDGKFGDAGKTVVIEEFLDGEEASFFAICDGAKAVACGSAQDHKRAYDGDQGPNTGGMGTYSPTPIVTQAMEDEIMQTIIQPTLDGLAKEGKPYSGFLFAGLMIKDGAIKLLEFNIRFGDPEAQSILPRLKTDIVPLLLDAAKGQLDANSTVEFASETALCVVMAAKGYPASYKKGTEIRSLVNAASESDVTIFHAGTKQEGDKLLAVGGRVLGVTALGTTVAEAQAKAYEAVDKIDWPEGFCRRDIGWRAIERLKLAS